MTGALRRSSRVASVAVAFCGAAAAALFAAADTPHSKSADLVTVRGCVHGTGITTVDESGTNGIPPQRFILTGSRATLSALKKHAGHLEEVTGRLKRGTPAGGSRVVEKPIDKGRVYMGVGSAPFERPGVASEPSAASSIEIRDFVHIGDRCAS
jgi:hypothetical protein